MTAHRRPTWQQLAARQAEVLGRAQALDAGLHARSWEHLATSASHHLVLPGVLLLSGGAPDAVQRAWAAVLCAGAGAAVAGRAALQLEGVRLHAPAVDVAVPAGRRVVAQPSAATRRSRAAARQREQQRWDGPRRGRRLVDLRVYEPDLVVVPRQVTGLPGLLLAGRTPPRVRAAPAALQAAAWADSAAAAEALLATVVQQRRAEPRQLLAALEQVPRLHRRGLVREVVEDLELGVQARGELLFLRLLRGAALPPPDRLQRPVRLGTSRRYLDAWWERQRVAVELDGAHHREAATWEADVLRANGVALGHRDDRVLLLRFTTGQVRHQQALVVRQLREALLP